MGLHEKLAKGEELTDEEMEWAAKYEGGELDEEEEKPAEEKPAEVEKPAEDPASEDPVALAMKQVGAKTAEELLEKVSGLRNNFTQKGQEAAIAAEESALKDSFYNALLAGDARAIDIARKHGIPVPGEHAAPAQVKPAEEGEEQIPEDVIDVVTYKRAKELERKLERIFAENEKKEQEAQAERARQAEYEQSLEFTLNQIDAVKDKLPQLFPEGIDVRGTAKKMYADGNVPESMSHIVKVLEYARTKGIGDLVDAARLYALDNDLMSRPQAQPQKPAATAPQPPMGLAAARGNGGGAGGTMAGASAITDAQFNKILNGSAPIPDGWFDAKGNPNYSVIPQKFHSRI